MRGAFLTVLCVLSFAELRADELSTLEFYLSKSPLVIVATVTEKPTGLRSAYLNYVTHVDVDEVLHGTLEEKSLHVSVNLPQKTEGPKKGQKYILFLKERQKPNKGWRTSDFWFGIQPYKFQLARGLRTTSADMIEAARWKPFRSFKKNGATMADFPLLTKLAKGNGTAVALRALSHMSDLKPNAELSSLLGNLMNNDDPKIALQAAIITCYSGDWSGFDHLLNCVDDADPELRRQAVAQLGSIQFIRYKERIVPAMIGRLVEEKNERVLERAIQSLGNYPSKSVLSKVKEFENHKNESIRKKTALVVHRISKSLNLEPHRSVRSRAEFLELQRSGN